MAQVNEYVQKLIAARDSDLFADVDPLNQLLKPKGETRTLSRRYIFHAKRHVSGHACAARNVMSPFLLDWMERGATNFNSPRTFAPAGTFAPDALLIVAG